MKKVTITADKTGKVFTLNVNADGSPKLDSKGRRNGFIRVENPEKISLDFSYNGENVKRGQSTLISMTEEAFLKNEKFYKAGTEIDGQVIVKETTESGLPGYKAKMAGSGENALPCLLGGAQIYRRTEFTSNVSAEDVLIAHDNSEAIKAAAKASAQAESLNK